MIYLLRGCPWEFEVVFLDETERAVLVEDDDGDEFWLPKSQIDCKATDDPAENDMIAVSVPEWLAIESGLMERSN